MASSYGNLVSKVMLLTQQAIKQRVRSDVFCHELVRFINDYGLAGHVEFSTGLTVKAPAPTVDDGKSVFAGNRAEDLSKLGQIARDADMTPEQERRLNSADDDGRSLLDDGDPFGD
jgi:hypothetical protein